MAKSDKSVSISIGKIDISPVMLLMLILLIGFIMTQLSKQGISVLPEGNKNIIVPVALILILIIFTANMRIENQWLQLAIILVGIGAIMYIFFNDRIQQAGGFFEWIQSVFFTGLIPDTKYDVGTTVFEEAKKAFNEQYARDGEVYIIGMAKANSIADTVGAREINPLQGIFTRPDYIVVVYPEILYVKEEITYMSPTDLWRHWTSGYHVMTITLPTGKEVTLKLKASLEKFDIVWGQEIVVECAGNKNISENMVHVSKSCLSQILSKLNSFR